MPSELSALDQPSVADSTRVESSSVPVDTEAVSGGGTTTAPAQKEQVVVAAEPNQQSTVPTTKSNSMTTSQNALFARYDSADDPVSHERTSEASIEVVPAPLEHLNDGQIRPTPRKSAGLGQPCFSSLLKPWGVNLTKTRASTIKIAPAPGQARSESKPVFMAPRPPHAYYEDDEEAARMGPRYVFREISPPRSRNGANDVSTSSKSASRLYGDQGFVSSSRNQQQPQEQSGKAPASAPVRPHHQQHQQPPQTAKQQYQKESYGSMMTRPASRPPSAYATQYTNASASASASASSSSVSAIYAQSTVPLLPVPDVSFRIMPASSRTLAAPPGNRAPARESVAMRKAPSRDRSSAKNNEPKPAREPVFLQRKAQEGIAREREASPRLLYFPKPIPSGAAIDENGTTVPPAQLPPLIPPSPEGGQKLKLAGRWAGVRPDETATNQEAGGSEEDAEGSYEEFDEEYDGFYGQNGQPSPKRARVDNEFQDMYAGAPNDIWDDDDDVDDGEIEMDSDDEEFGVRGSRSSRPSLAKRSSSSSTKLRGRPRVSSLSNGGGERSLAGTLWTPPSAKPFTCPNSNCDKRFKNANGVKYHVLHGTCHTAPIGADGLFEVDESKPHICWSPDCDRAYKNANGLRYHYAHSGEHGMKGAEMLRLGTHPRPSKIGSQEGQRSKGSSGEGSPAPDGTVASRLGPNLDAKITRDGFFWQGALVEGEEDQEDLEEQEEEDEYQYRRRIKEASKRMTATNPTANIERPSMNGNSDTGGNATASTSQPQEGIRPVHFYASKSLKTGAPNSFAPPLTVNPLQFGSTPIQRPVSQAVAVSRPSPQPTSSSAIRPSASAFSIFAPQVLERSKRPSTSPYAGTSRQVQSQTRSQAQVQAQAQAQAQSQAQAQTSPTDSNTSSKSYKKRSIGIKNRSAHKYHTWKNNFIHRKRTRSEGGGSSSRSPQPEGEGGERMDIDGSENGYGDENGEEVDGEGEADDEFKGALDPALYTMQGVAPTVY